MGLAGTGGILPSHYTQLLIDRVREKDFGLRDFLDLFNHRLIAQFYRAWEKCHFYVGYESVAARQGEETGPLYPDAVQPCRAWARPDCGTGRPFPTKCSCITPGTSPIGRGRPWRWNRSSVMSFTFRPTSSNSGANGCICGRADQTRLRPGGTTSSACRQLPVDGSGASRTRSEFDLAR